MTENFQVLLNNLWNTALTMGVLVIGLWVIHLVDTFLLRQWLKKQFGIRPRTHFNPLNLLIAPLLHVDFGHLAANTIPFFVLGGLVMVQGSLVFWLASLIIALVGGLGVWFFGQPNTLHVGASILILGYFGFLLGNVYASPDLATIIIAVIVAIFYLGLIWQIVPLKQGVSTAGHLFGFVGGVLAALIPLILN